MKNFKNKVVLVTGASSGIGRATAFAFAKEGAKVVVAARRVKEGEETVELIKKAGGEGLFIQTDVTQEKQVKNLGFLYYGRASCHRRRFHGSVNDFKNNGTCIGDWLWQ